MTNSASDDISSLITENIDIWTSAIKQKSAVGRGSSKKISLHGIKKLRELILELAVRGKLVPQDPNDEPASVLLERIAIERVQLVKDKKIKTNKAVLSITKQDIPSNIPKSWAVSKLDFIGTSFIGLTYSPKDAGDEGVPVLRSSNIQKNKIDLNDIVRVKKEIRDNLFVEEGDLLICSRNGSKALVGKTAMIKGLLEPMTFGAFMAIYKSSINSYIEVFLNSPVFRKMLNGVSTTTINQITQSNLKNTIVFIPPEKEQDRIVAKVDELMALCDHLEQETESSIDAHKTLVELLLTTLTDSKNSEELKKNWSCVSEHFDTLFTTEHSIDALKQTILQLAVMGKLVPQDPNDEPASKLLERIAAEKALLIKDKKIKRQKALPPITDEEKPFVIPDGWECTYMQDLCSLITDGTHQTPKYSKTGRPFISAQCVKPFKFIPENCRFVSEEHYQNYIKNRKPEYRDILLSRVGAGIGEAAIIDTNLEFAIYVSTGLLKPFHSQLFSEYIVLWLNSPIGRGYSERNTLGKGVSQGNLNLSLIRGFIVTLPSLEEQQRIVTKVEELMAICDQLKSRLNQVQHTQLNLADTIITNAI